MVQITVARAEAKIASARAWLREAVADVWDTILAGDPPGPRQRIRVRLAITHGISTAAGVADVLQQVAGAATVAEDHPLQRRFQDLRTAAAHVQAAPSIFELTGGLLLGADVPPSVLL
jgi:alkylation response protein AidB-like acyl-CoA dehydrogenase